MYITGRRKEVLDSACEELRANAVAATGLQGDVREQASCNRSVQAFTSRSLSAPLNLFDVITAVVAADGSRRWLQITRRSTSSSTARRETSWLLLKNSHKTGFEQVENLNQSFCVEDWTC